MNKSKNLDKQSYVELKNLAYYAYDIYHKSSKEKADTLLQGFLNKYSTDDEKQIFTNTLLCPFDMELCQFLVSNKLTEENILFINSRFNISKEIIEQKGREYFNYSYLQCVGEGLIDYSIIFELSKEFLENSSDIEKNRKVLSFGKNNS